MKLKKLFAGMAASVLAASCMAISAAAADPVYNFVLITTDIPVDAYTVDEETGALTKDGVEVVVKDITVKMGSNEYTATTAPFKSDEKFLCFEIINKWDSKFTPEVTDYTVPGEGESLEVTFTIEGIDGVTGKAGIAFQTDGTWNFRNTNGSDTSAFAAPAAFPNAVVGVQGGASGFDTDVAVTDADINGSGTYTVSIAQSGEIDVSTPGDGDFTDEDGNVTGDHTGYKWNARENETEQRDPAATDDSKKDDSKTDDSKTDDSKTDDTKKDDTTKTDDTKKDDTKTSDTTKTDDTKSTDTKSTDNKSTDTKSTDTKSTDTKTTTTSTTTAKSGNAASTATTGAAGTATASDATDVDNSNAATGASEGLALAGLAIAGTIAIASKKRK